MTQPAFSISVTDLEKGPKEVSWELPAEWLARALEDTEAQPRTDGKVEAHLSLNGREVLVRGRIQVTLTMPCVATLEPVKLDLSPELFLLLSPPPPPPGPTPKRQRTGSADGREQPSKRGGHLMDASNATKGWERDPELAADDVARDTYDGQKVVLDDFIREFIVLELPMAPRRSDLPSPTDAATTPAPLNPDAASGPSVDPRLAPLVDIANRMRKTKE